MYFYFRYEYMLMLILVYLHLSNIENAGLLLITEQSISTVWYFYLHLSNEI